MSGSKKETQLTLNPEMKSTWSFDWNKESNTCRTPNEKSKLGGVKYKNESQFTLNGEKATALTESRITKSRGLEKEDFSKKLKEYNPKTAGQTTLCLGTDKTDFRPRNVIIAEQQKSMVNLRNNIAFK